MLWSKAIGAVGTLGGEVEFVTSDFDFSTTASGSVNVNTGDLVLVLSQNGRDALAAPTNTTSTLINESGAGVRLRVDYTVAATTGTFASSCNGGSATPDSSFFAIIVFRRAAELTADDIGTYGSDATSVIFKPSNVASGFSNGGVMLAYAAVDNPEYLTESPFLNSESFIEIIAPLGVSAGGGGDMGVSYYLCDGNEPTTDFTSPMSASESYITVLISIKPA